jgi:hypothetical protein
MTTSKLTYRIYKGPDFGRQLSDVWCALRDYTYPVSLDQHFRSDYMEIVATYDPGANIRTLAAKMMVLVDPAPVAEELKGQ